MKNDKGVQNFVFKFVVDGVPIILSWEGTEGEYEVNIAPRFRDELTSLVGNLKRVRRTIAPKENIDVHEKGMRIRVCRGYAYMCSHRISISDETEKVIDTIDDLIPKLEELGRTWSW